jgi:hypothetical protein
MNMDVFIPVGALFGIAGGVAYAAVVFLKPLLERLLIRVASCRCYEDISAGEEFYWEELQALYALECKRVTGMCGARLEPQEGHEIVARLRWLCEQTSPVDTRWEARLRDLTRSLPQHWAVTAATGEFYPTVIAGVMLFGQASIAAALLNRLPHDMSPLWITLATAIPALLFSLSGVPTISSFAKAKRDARKREAAILNKGPNRSPAT